MVEISVEMRKSEERKETMTEKERYGKEVREHEKMDVDVNKVVKAKKSKKGKKGAPVVAEVGAAKTAPPPTVPYAGAVKGKEKKQNSERNEFTVVTRKERKGKAEEEKWMRKKPETAFIME